MSISRRSTAAPNELRLSCEITGPMAPAPGSKEPRTRRSADHAGFDAKDQPTYNALCIKHCHLAKFPDKTMEIRKQNLKAIRPGDPLFLFECGAGLRVDGCAVYRLVWKAKFVKNVPMPNLASFRANEARHHCSQNLLPRGYDPASGKLVGWQLSDFEPMSEPRPFVFERKRSERSRFKFRMSDLVPLPPSSGFLPVCRVRKAPSAVRRKRARSS